MTYLQHLVDSNILLIVSRIILIALNLLADIIGNFPIIKQFNSSFLLFLVEMFINVLLVYIICSLIDFIRIRLLEPKYMKAIQNLIEKMKEKDDQ